MRSPSPPSSPPPPEVPSGKPQADLIKVVLFHRSRFCTAPAFFASTFSCLSKRKRTEREGHQRGECFVSFPSLDSPLSATKRGTVRGSPRLIPPPGNAHGGISIRGGRSPLFGRCKGRGPGRGSMRNPLPERAFSFSISLCTSKEKWSVLLFVRTAPPSCVAFIKTI